MIVHYFIVGPILYHVDFLHKWNPRTFRTDHILPRLSSFQLHCEGSYFGDVEVNRFWELPLGKLKQESQLLLLRACLAETFACILGNN